MLECFQLHLVRLCPFARQDVFPLEIGIHHDDNRFVIVQVSHNHRYLIHSGQLAAPAPSTTYPLAGVVTTVDRAADLVTFRTGSGHLYSLTGCDDWLPGDVIACTMDDNGTPHDVTDDTITQYRYCGYVS